MWTWIQLRLEPLCKWGAPVSWRKRAHGAFPSRGDRISSRLETGYPGWPRAWIKLTSTRSGLDGKEIRIQGTRKAWNQGLEFLMKVRRWFWKKEKEFCSLKSWLRSSCVGGRHPGEGRWRGMDTIPVQGLWGPVFVVCCSVPRDSDRVMGGNKW